MMPGRGAHTQGTVFWIEIGIDCDTLHGPFLILFNYSQGRTERVEACVENDIVANIEDAGIRHT